MFVSYSLAFRKVFPQSSKKNNKIDKDLADCEISSLPETNRRTRNS